MYKFFGENALKTLIGSTSASVVWHPKVLFNFETILMRVLDCYQLLYSELKKEQKHISCIESMNLQVARKRELCLSKTHLVYTKNLKCFLQFISRNTDDSFFSSGGKDSVLWKQINFKQTVNFAEFTILYHLQLKCSTKFFFCISCAHTPWQITWFHLISWISHIKNKNELRSVIL